MKKIKNKDKRNVTKRLKNGTKILSCLFMLLYEYYLLENLNLSLVNTY